VILLKCLKKQNMRCCIDDLAEDGDHRRVLHENSDEPSGSIKFVEFLDQLSKY
jgi:hypothetical protein